MLNTSGIITLSKGPWMNLQFLWWPLHGIPSRLPLKNNTTLLEATRTSTRDGPPYLKKGTRQYQTSPIFSIPYATKSGIKDSERHMVLKYHGCLHRYIQT
jgi:hypothetical protein